jgi:hypothetical protein
VPVAISHSCDSMVKLGAVHTILSYSYCYCFPQTIPRKFVIQKERRSGVVSQKRGEGQAVIVNGGGGGGRWLEESVSFNSEEKR